MQRLKVRDGKGCFIAERWRDEDEDGECFAWLSDW